MDKGSNNQGKPSLPVLVYTPTSSHSPPLPWPSPLSKYICLTAPLQDNSLKSISMDSVDFYGSAKAGIESTFTLIWDGYNQEVPCQI